MVTVMHVIECLIDCGGTPRTLLYLAKHHADPQTRLVFFCYTPSPLKDVFREYGAEVIEYQTIHPLKLIQGLRREIKQRQVDVLCSHLSRPLIVGSAAARLADIPFIHNEHSSAAYRQGVAFHLAKLCLPSAQAVICNSRYTRDSIQRAYRLPDELMHVVYNPVEPRAITSTRAQVRQELALKPDQPLIGHVGGMIPSRDQANLLRAFHQLRMRYTDAALLMMGDGPLRGDLEALTAELGITDAVHFLGYTDRIGDYLEALDIYVNPTIDEGLGIAVVEAMLAGVPVVLADRGAHRELVNNGENGVLYPGGDVAALRACLETLIADPGLRHRLAERGRERAQLYAPHRYAAGYGDVVQSVLDKTLHRRTVTGWTR